MAYVLWFVWIRNLGRASLVLAPVFHVVAVRLWLELEQLILARLSHFI